VRYGAQHDLEQGDSAQNMLFCMDSLSTTWFHGVSPGAQHDFAHGITVPYIILHKEPNCQIKCSYAQQNE
jgi:hypothetical protein